MHWRHYHVAIGCMFNLIIWTRQQNCSCYRLLKVKGKPKFFIYILEPLYSTQPAPRVVSPQSLLWRHTPFQILRHNITADQYYGTVKENLRVQFSQKKFKIFQNGAGKSCSELNLAHFKPNLIFRKIWKISEFDQGCVIFTELFQRLGTHFARGEEYRDPK